MDIDRYCDPSGNGWIYRFPNGYQPSVIVDHRSNLRFEIFLPSADNGHEVIKQLGGQGGLLIGLTTDQAERKLTQIALLPTFDPSDPNPAVLAEPSASEGAGPILTFRDGSQQYGPYTNA